MHDACTSWESDQARCTMVGEEDENVVISRTLQDLATSSASEDLFKVSWIHIFA